MVKGNVTRWFKDCFMSVSLAFWHKCFLEPEVTIFGLLGRALGRLQYISVLTGRSIWLTPQVGCSCVLPLMESVLPHDELELKSRSRKLPQLQALRPCFCVYNTGFVAIFLNICLGWRSAEQRGSQRVRVCVERRFLWTEIRVGSAPITSMFTPTHLDHPSIFSCTWRDHVIRTRVSLTIWTCPTKVLR